MATISEQFLAYIAGFFDGEGSISIIKGNRKDKPHWNPSYTLSVSIHNTNKTVLEEIQKEFGGNLFKLNKRCGLGKKQLYQWAASANIAENFLLKILPYLIVKKEQALLGIEFQSSRLDTRNGQGQRTPKEELEKREEFRIKISTLNKSGELYGNH